MVELLPGGCLKMDKASLNPWNLKPLVQLDYPNMWTNNMMDDACWCRMIKSSLLILLAYVHQSNNDVLI